MLIAGLQKLSLLDYPGEAAAVVFTPYCNMNCSYCHNAHIIGRDAPLMEEEEVLEYLHKRCGLLGAVVVSGGEPTLQPTLPLFLRLVREMGFLVKLDTNGTKPEVIKSLMQQNLLDYVAMDLKASERKYDEITRGKNDMQAIRKSIFYLRNGSVAHEFRTTFAPELTREDILAAVELIEGTDRFFLQQYRKPSDHDAPPHPPTYVKETAKAVREKIGVCVIRGL